MLSQNPTDVLIRSLIRTGRDATAEEVGQIAQRISVASFPDTSRHLARRITERQWSPGTTEHAYLEDLRRAARYDMSRIAIYVRRGGNLSAILAQSERVLPAHRRGEKSLPLLFVVYSADRAIILSGYQATSLQTIALPEDIRWLR